MQYKRFTSFLFFVCLAVLGLHRLHAYDIWWQIAAGDWILTHGFPSTDPFSYGFPDGAWIEPRWLFCVAVNALFRLAGASGLILAKLALAVLTFGVLWRLVRPAATLATWVGCTLALLLMQERLLVRPELVSFLALALTLACLTRYHAAGNRRWLYVLPALQLLWCNAHTLWILGPATQWILWGASWIRVRRLNDPTLRATGLAALGSTVVVLLNPWGLQGALFPLRLFGQLGSDHLLGRLISEFRSPFSAPFFALDFRTISYVVAVLISAGLFALNYRRLHLPRLLLWIAFLFLSFKAQRNVALFGLVAGWATIENLADLREFGSRVTRSVIAVLLVALAGWAGLAITDRYYTATGSDKRFGLGLSDRYPIEALVVARQARPTARIFNTLGDGGYQLFEGGAGSVYVDGRLEVYTPQEMALALTATMDGATFRAELQRVRADRVLVRNLPAHREMLRVLEADRSWQPIFHSSRHVLYAAVGTIPPELELIDWQRPLLGSVARPEGLESQAWPFPQRVDEREDLRLAALYIAVGSFAAAEQRYERVLVTNPTDRTAALYLGLIRRAQGRDAEAGQLLAQVSAAKLDTANVQFFAGELHRRGRRPQEALGYYRRAVELGAPRPAAEIGLIQAALAAGQRGLALETLEIVRHDFPQHPEAESLLGVARTQVGDLAGAIEAFERAFQLDPQQGPVARMLGDLYAQQGNALLSQRWYEQADRINSKE